MRWYVSQNGKASGPFEEKRLAQLVQWGKVTRDAFICDEHSSAWIALRRSAFAPLLPAASAAQASGEAAPVEPSARKHAPGGNLDEKLAFGLLASCFLLAGVLMATV